MHWSVGTKLSMGFGVALAMLVLLGSIAFAASPNSSRPLTGSRTRTRCNGRSARWASSSSSTPAGQRGYLITGVESFLEPYHAASPVIAPHLKALRAFTADNGPQQRRMETLERLKCQPAFAVPRQY